MRGNRIGDGFLYRRDLWNKDVGAITYEDDHAGFRNAVDVGKAYRAAKSIQDYVFTDGIADDNNEKKFVRSLDQATEVCVYRNFHVVSRSRLLSEITHRIGR